MIRLLNITTDQYDLARFSSVDDLREFTCSHGLDGIEVLPIGKPDSLSWIPPKLVPGMHLSYYNSWYDAYIGDEEKVIAEYGSLAEAERILGGPAREIALRLRAQLDFCQKLDVKYVVWHVGNITLSETATCRFEHDSASVISAAIEIINAALDGQKYSFDFLVENLWGPGFTFTEPELTRTLLEGIEYPRKGIMLDVGHLMHINGWMRMATCAGIFAECTCTVAQAARLCGGWRRNRLYLPAVILISCAPYMKAYLNLTRIFPWFAPACAN